MSEPTIPNPEWLINGRPAWLADVIAIHGEPRIAVDEEQRLNSDEHGTYYRRTWAWFTPLNCNIKINRFWKHWEIGVSAWPLGSASLKFPTAPTDEQVRGLLTLLGWPLTPVPVDPTRSPDPEMCAGPVEIPGVGGWACGRGLPRQKEQSDVVH